MNNEKVEIASFNWLNDAQMACLELETHGIDAEMFEIGIAAANPLLGNTVGGVKIKVVQKDVEQAILKEYEKRKL